MSEFWSGDQPAAMSTRYRRQDLEAAFNRFSEFILLGEGGFGAVFAVWDRVRKQYVALKLSADKGDALYRKRFEREYEILRIVHSPRLVAVYDSGSCRIRIADGTLDSHLWYTMERCASSIDSELSRLKLPERVRLCLEMLDGISALHEHDIAHRDIKPKNLFLAEDDELKIGDFGIARDTARNGTEPTPSSQAAIGTYEYLAPERWRGEEGGKEDWRPSDQYAAGVTVFKLLSRGKDPLDFGAGNMFACLNAHLTGQVRHIGIPEHPGVPFRAVDKVIAKMLAKEPTKRYPTIARCKREFESALKMHGLA